MGLLQGQHRRSSGSTPGVERTGVEGINFSWVYFRDNIGGVELID